MDEKQNATTHATTNDTGPDDSKPTPERQVELRKAYEANIAVGRSPYAGVEINTRGELNWNIQERNWTDKGGSPNFLDLRGSLIQANLGNIDLSVSNLSGVWVISANFAEADLTFTNFSGAFIAGSNFTKAIFSAADLRDMVLQTSSFAGAQLNAVNLSGTRIVDCDFSDADLTVARLEHTLFEPVNLKGADLRIANLSGAMIAGALEGANLRRARMDAGTVFGGYGEQGTVRLDTQTCLLDVAWNGAILATVAWELVPRLGDEADIKSASTRKGRLQAYQQAARAYSGL